MTTRLSLGAIPYYWPRADVHAYYDAVAQSRADIVYLGEVVCGKRHELRLDDWIAIGRALASTGKEIVLSGLALAESETDLRVMRRIAANGEFRVEANDMGMVRLAASAKVPFVIGLHVNAYNPATLRLLRECGAVRWVTPIELSADALRELCADPALGLETEVLAYGRLPLALSARCFTARARNRSKDDCGFVCRDDPDGLALDTREGQPLFVLNGIQTQSARPYSLAGVLPDVVSLGVGVLRVVPRREHSLEALGILRDCLDGACTPAAAEAALEALAGPASGGYWRAAAGIDVAQAATA